MTIRAFYFSTLLTAFGIVLCRSVPAAHAQTPVTDAPVDRPADRMSASGVAAALVQAGYIGVPFHWDTGGYPITDVKIANKVFPMMLDAGFDANISDFLIDTSIGMLPGIRVVPVKASITYNFAESSEGYWAAIDRLSLGSFHLDSVFGFWLSDSPYQPIHGFLGAGTFINRQAIFDFSTDTVYFLAGAEPPAAVVRPVPAPAKNLRAALEAAGHYRTFLTLAQEAGLMPLLEGTLPADATLDSVSWAGHRFRVYAYTGADTIDDVSERRERVNSGLEKALHRNGQLTAFVPTDEAFAQLPPSELGALRADKARLAQLLRGHILTDVFLDLQAMRTLVRGALQPAGAALGFQVIGPRTGVDRQQISPDPVTGAAEGLILSRAIIAQPNLTAANGIAHGIDGVLGLRLYTPAPYAALLAREGYVAVPMFRQPYGGHHYVRGTVGGVPATLIVDTGDPDGLALNPQPASATLTLGTLPIPVGHADSSAQSAGNGVPPQGYQGNIGSKFLREYHAVMDLGTGTMYLRSPKASKP